MKKNIKYLSLILILSLIIPFCPSVNVSADLTAVVPDFPYNQDFYYNINNGSFALWQVHGSTHISYVQTFTPNNISYPDPIVIFKKALLQSNNKYYLDVNFIIDSWDISGVHIDGYPFSSNIAIPKPSETYVSDVDVYATLLYSTDNVMWKNGTDVGIYKYWNYLPPSYADPTPTPAPVQPNYFPTVTDARYTALSYYDAVKLVMMRFYSETENKYMIRYFTLFSERNRSNQIKSYPVVTSVTDNSGVIRVDFYNQIVGGYPPNYNMYGSEENGIIYFDSLEQILDTTVSLSNHVISLNSPTSLGSDLYYFTYTPTDDYYFEDAIFGNINSDGTVDFDGSGGGVPATPTPTTAPTPIPQPTTNPDPSPTTPPDVKVVEPSAHWWDGLVKPIQYIFVPSSDKMMKTYNTFANKFGVQKPTKFEFDANALVRPRNITWNFKHVSLDGNDNTVTQITLVDFVMIDGWLESSAGQMIIGIIRAVFTLLMWGYLIYIFQKHIATINYTDAHTLIEQSRKGGNSDD